MNEQDGIPAVRSIDRGIAEQMVPDFDPQATSAAFIKLIDIMAALRGPDGCPWDKEQTHLSISQSAVEEAYEVQGAIEDGDAEALREELGDLLLQVVFHAEMAAEAGEFTLLDVIEGISSKLIRRHPHVFGVDVALDAAAFTAEEREQVASIQSAGEVVDLWDHIKLHEKRLKAEHRREMAQRCGKDPDFISSLEDISRAQPALMQAQDISRKVAAMGFDWHDTAEVWEQFDSERNEFNSASNSTEREDEMGDLLFSLVNVARHEHIDAERALRSTCKKFRMRWYKVEQEIRNKCMTYQNISHDELEQLWKSAKDSLAEESCAD